MFDDIQAELELEIAASQSKLHMIRTAEVFLGVNHMSPIHVQEYLLELVIVAREFRHTTGSDLARVANDGLEHWRKQEKGTYTPVIDPAEYVDAREDDA